MISTPAPALPDCAKRLTLQDCLQRWRSETEQGVVDTGRYHCRYVVWGQGPTLVLIPGTALDAYAFVMLMARLQASFRCVSFALPDGDADGAHLMSYRHADLVADLFALLDHLSIRQCSLFGSSLGSTIALAALHAQPGRFSHALLQGAFARRPLAPAEVLAASFARFCPGRLGQLPFARQLLEHAQRDWFQLREPEVLDFFVQHHLRATVRALATRALMLHKLDLRPILPAIRLPVLIICGDRDTLIGKRFEEELSKGLPLVARAEIEQCGHVPQLTHPEVLAELVGQFLLPTSCAAACAKS